MGQPRASTLPDTRQFPKVIGSTAKILVELYKNQLHLKGSPENDPVIKSAVALDMQTADTKKQLSGSSINSLSQVSEAITVSLGQLKTVSPETKAYALQQEGVLGELKGRTEGLHNQREALSKRYAELVDEQFNIMGQLLTNEKSSSEEVKRKIAEFEKKRVNLADEVKNYTQQFTKLQTDLNTLYNTVYPQVPDKSKIPAPTTVEAPKPGRT